MAQYAVPSITGLSLQITDIMSRAKLLPYPFSSGQGEEPAKANAVTAVLELAQEHLEDDLQQEISAQYQECVAMYGDNDFTDDWQEGFQEEFLVPHFTPLIGFVGAVPFGEVAIGVWSDKLAGMLGHDVAGELAKLWIAKITPDVGDRGKFLSAVGIVKAHLDELTAGFNANETLDDMPLITPPGYSTAPVPPPLSSPKSPLIPPPPAPAIKGKATSEALNHAYKQFRDGCRIDETDITVKLTMSKQTFTNYATGKTPAKCSLAQARELVAEIDRRVAMLQEAANIFGSVT